MLPLEESILEIGLRREAAGEAEFHGFAIAAELGAEDDNRRLLGHGTLYKALSRLETAGLLESRWEEIDTTVEGRPRRRLYRVTGSAAAALVRSAATQRAAGRVARERWALS